jgi:hypothetical protein
VLLASPPAAAQGHLLLTSVIITVHADILAALAVPLLTTHINIAFVSEVSRAAFKSLCAKKVNEEAPGLLPIL